MSPFAAGLNISDSDCSLPVCQVVLVVVHVAEAFGVGRATSFFVALVVGAWQSVTRTVTLAPVDERKKGATRSERV